MMYGFAMYSGWWLIGMGMMVLFWVTIILLVIWVVHSLFPRQVRSGRDQASLLSQWQSFSYTFNTPGMYQYYCTVHPNMVATVTVVS